MNGQSPLVLALITGLVGANLLAFLWMAFTVRKIRWTMGAYDDRIRAIKKETERVFTDDFREELRNRGRLYFEKIINENAMFLKQDLGLTASQLNEYMQHSLKKVLDEEFDKYQQTIVDAKEAALSAITKTRVAMEEQRESMSKELEAEVAKEKARLIGILHQRLAHILNSYILEVMAGEVDLTSQTDYIFSRLDEQKAEIIKDLESEI